MIVVIFLLIHKLIRITCTVMKINKLSETIKRSITTNRNLTFIWMFCSPHIIITWINYKSDSLRC